MSLKHWAILAGCGILMTSFLAQGKEPTNASDDLSFTAQCPKLLAVADNFANECIQKAQTWSYQAVTDIMWNKITVSQTAYFRQDDPKSHFALGCVLRNNDRKKIDYIGIYYTPNGSNFNIPGDAKLNGYDRNGGINFKVNGKPIYFVLIRPFVTKTLPFSDENSGQYYLVDSEKGFGRPKNCENVALSNYNTTISKNVFIRRELNKGNITIKTCLNPLCDTALNEEKHPSSANYIKFFGGDDQQIIYGSFSSHFFIESGGGLLIKSDLLKKNCGSFSIAKFLFDFHDDGGVPHIESQVCNIPPSSN